MDQSDNYTVQHWSFTHSGCDITGHLQVLFGQEIVRFLLKDLSKQQSLDVLHLLQDS